MTGWSLLFVMCLFVLLLLCFGGGGGGGGNYNVCHKYFCISYVTAVRYVSAINHEARGRAAPEGE